MKYLLSSRNVEVLRQLAWSNVLLGFDYDGTLAPIVDAPEAARIRLRTRGLLQVVADLYPTVVISGRGQADIMRRVRGIGVREVIGNHGLEPWRYNGPFASQVRVWMPKLTASLAGLKGVLIEDKVFSIAIHYRNCRERRRARAEILKAIAQLGPLRIIGGKLVFNVLAENAPHKGLALLGARQRARCDTALYVGDDETDEDVFALDEPGRLVTARVERRTASLAPYFIRSQNEIDDLLQALIAARSRAAGRGDPERDESDRGAA